jgi:hypothetical protein
MDSDELYAHARRRFDHETARRILKEKYEARMLFAHAGGMWRAGPDLVVLLQACPATDSVVILDLYETPVRVDPQELRRLAQQRWQEQMTAWLIEHDQNSRRR